MFKCTECGTEYEIKPDYCDCGNDTFEEIKPAAVEPAPVKIEKKPEPKPQPKVKPQPTKTFSAPKVDPVSLTIFLACIVLSFIILFFVGNPKEQTEEEKVFEETTITDIPKIDKFWNNSTVGVVSDKQEPVEQPVVQQVQQLVQKVIPQTTKPVQKIQTPKVTTKPKTTAKPAVQKPAAQTAKPQNTTKTTTQTTQKPATTTPKIPQTTLNVTQNQQTTQPQTTQPQTTTKPATTTQQTQPKTQTNTAAAQQELVNYKVSLRNTIGRKIDFTKVVGDGNCSITFKVSSSGQLTNRAFSKLSGNITLNDAVYNAMKATPSFSAPPASYKGETLTLTIKFTNGNFAITLN